SDAYLIADLSHAAFHDIAGAQLAPDFLHVDSLPLESERRVSSNDQQIPESTKLGNDVFGQAIREVLLLWVTRYVGERQNCDRRFVRRGHGRGNRDCRGAGNPVGAHRFRDVLQRLGAEIFEPGFDLAADVFITGAGDQDATWFRQGFQAHRDVDAVAVDVAALNHHVSE